MIADFLEFEFLRNALIAGILIGMVAPLLGVFIVIRRQSLIADALSHVTLSGIAFGLLLQKSVAFLAFLNPIYMGTLFSVIGALLIEKLRDVYKFYQELAVPIILSAGIGIGVIFISLADGFNTDLFSYLFGSVSAVSREDLLTIIFITVLVLVVTVTLFKELFLLSFDEEYAEATGLKSKWIHFIFILMVALVISASMRIVGVLLVSALMTLPVAASIRIARGFRQTVFYSILFGEISVIGGIAFAYYFNLAPGGTIVMIAVALLLIAMFIRNRRAA